MSYRSSFGLFIGAVAVGGVLTPSPPAAGAAGAPVVLAIRHSATPQRTRVVVDVSQSCGHRVSLLPDSSGLVVRVAGASRAPSVGARAVDRNHVRSVNAFDTPSGVEVVLDLDTPLEWKDFVLPATAGQPYRIVVDLSTEPARPAPPGPGAGTAAATAPPVRERVEPRPLVVAIDAGHGGHDSGAMGRGGLVEKRLTLDIARRTAEALNREGAVRAVLVRDSDVYLTLPARNEVAKKKGADVFVSIHLNSAPSRSARGAEIFFVAPGGAKRAANQALSSGAAAHEFGLEGDPNDDIVHILLDVNQQTVLTRSEQLAESILEAVRSHRLMPTRAVKQKSFSVLRTIEMPSVLVEAGFLTNASDAKLLSESSGRERIARAIAEGVTAFFRTHPPVRDDNGRTIVHRVQRGDTLWDLSRRYQTTIARLRELNGLRASQSLRVGQEIVVQPGR